MGLETIALTKLVPHPGNPTRNEGIDELAKSIETTGLLHPLHVVKVPGSSDVGGEGEIYHVIAGCRRLEALKRLDPNDLVECVVHSQDVDIEMVRYAENEHRINVHPLDQSAHVAIMVEEQGGSPEVVAELVGSTPYRVRQLIQVWKLPDSVKKLYREEKLCWAHIRLLVQCTDPKRQEELAESWAADDWHGWNPPERCRKDLTDDVKMLSKAPWKLDDADLPGGACSECQYNSKTGDSFLFEDLADKARCTNGTCYAEKGEAFQNVTLLQLEERGCRIMARKDVQKRERAWSTNGWVPLSMGLAEFSGGSLKSKKHLHGLVGKDVTVTYIPLPDWSVEPHARRLEIEKVLIEKGLATNDVFGYTDDYRPGAPIPKSKEYVNKDKELQKRARKNQIVVREVAKAATRKILDMDPGNEEAFLPIWRIVASEYLARWDHTVLTRFAKERGIELPKGETPSRYSYGPLLEKKVGESSTQEILAMMLECVIWGQWPAKYRPELRNETKEIAQVLGIELKPFHDLARAKMRPRRRGKK